LLRPALVSALATTAALGLLRAVAVGLGGDREAASLAAAAAAAAFGVGALASGRPTAPALRHGAALVASLVMVVAQHLAPFLQLAIHASGEAWRADVATFGLGVALLGLPLATLGAGVGGGIGVNPLAALAGALPAIAVVESSVVPAPVVSVVALLSPVAVALMASPAATVSSRRLAVGAGSVALGAAAGLVALSHRAERDPAAPPSESAALPAAIDVAAAARGEIGRVLVVSASSDTIVERLRARGALEVDFAPLARADGRGLRAPAGLRGYDLVVLPPQALPAAGAAAPTPARLRALEAAVASQGVAAFFLDLATTPVALVEECGRALAGGGAGRALLVSDGLRAPALGVLRRAGGAALAAGAALDPPPPSIGRAVLGWLPPISDASGAADLDDSLARIERWAREPGTAALARAMRALASERLPDAADGVVAALAADATRDAARVGYAQIAERFVERAAWSALADLARRARDVDPSSWVATRDSARARRELGDPAAAIEELDRTPAARLPAAEVAVAIERAAALFALGRGDDAFAGLRATFEKHTTSRELALALADASARLGRAEESLTWSRVAETLARIPPSARRH